MPFKPFKPLLAIATLLFTSSTFAASPVWKVSKGDQHLYIGGTIHLLSNSDYPLPKAFDTAYKKSSELVFETDMQKIQTPVFMQKLFQGITLSGGETLQSTLKPETYKALSEYFTSRSLPIAQFASYSPAGVSITISILELQKLGMRPEAGVDQFYSQLAINDGKKLGQLETPDEHIAFISNMGKGNEDALIMKTLKDIETLPQMMGNLKSAWREGDNEKLDKDTLIELKKAFPAIYASLLVQRNNAWLPKIKNLMKTPEVELILVGALHLAGKEGLLNQLKSQGYKIENL